MAVAGPPSSASLELTKSKLELHAPPITTVQDPRRPSAYTGDVIFTGTPGKTQRVDRGDTIEVTIGGVGTLRNTVAGASR